MKVFNQKLTRQDTSKYLINELKARNELKLITKFTQEIVPLWNYISDSGQKFNVFICRDDVLPKIQNPEEVEIKLLLVREKIEDINYFYKLLEYFKTI